MKMADVEIYPFGDHDMMDAQPAQQVKLSLSTQVGGRATWRLEHEQETSFRGKTQITRLKEVQIEGLHQKLTEITYQTPDASYSAISNSEMRKCTTKTRACP